MGSIRVGVIGATGRMGRTVCDAVVAADDLELVAAVDVHGGEVIQGLEVSSDLKSVVEASCDVVVDFTTAEAARETLQIGRAHV